MESSVEDTRGSSPLRAYTANGNDKLHSALDKISEGAWYFDKSKHGEFMKTLECRSLDKQNFKNSLRSSMNCRLSQEELDALMPFVQNGDEVDGTKFLLLFYRSRFDKRDQMLKLRLEKERIAREETKKFKECRERKIIEGPQLRLSTDFTEADLASAMEKVTEAAVKYDRLMPGTVQTDAFEIEYMSPAIFREQIRRVFNLRLSMKEYSALCKYFDKDNEGHVYCAEFLTFFFRKGFEEKSRRIRLVWDREKKAAEMREQQKLDDIERLQRKNQLKVDFRFREQDKTEALMKLREAARLYSKDSSAAMSMKSFETAKMLPHEFKEQLKRIFNLHLTPPQLGALMSIFDANGDGFITCQEFTKCFMNLSFQEHANAMREERERQKSAEEARKVSVQKQQEEIARKEALKVNFEYTDADFNRAIAKLSEAAWRYDKNLPGSASLAAFEGQSMPPSVFKEQLRCNLGIKLTPQELGALMSYFDKFMITFIKTGFTEKFRRRQQYRQFQVEKEERDRTRAESIKQQLEQKNALKVQYEFTEEEFTSAMNKLTYAAMQYDRSMPGCVQLNAFECESMLPHVFKEQLKLVFGIKLTPPELGALMTYFDKNEDGVINCNSFIVQFLRTGFEERNRVRKEYSALLKQREQYRKVQEGEKLKREAERQLREVDYDFTEKHFDSSLHKLISLCHRFDGRTLGPGGWRAFEAASLTPAEFKEMMKRTFNVQLNSQELGALVTYFDINMTGSVSCFHFLNCFVQMRVKLESFKGKCDEQEHMALFHAQLKESYKNRIQKQMNASVDNMTLRPWRTALGISTEQSLQALKASKSKRKNYPKTPTDKLKRRLYIGRISGKMDLSTKSSWLEREITLSADDETIETLDSRKADIVIGASGSDNNKSPVAALKKSKASTNKTNIIIDSVEKNMKRTNIVFTDWVEIDITDVPPLPGSTANTEINSSSNAAADSSNKSVVSTTSTTELRALMDASNNLGTLMFNKRAFDIRLGSIPLEVFRMTNLRELWLCNNCIQAVPSEIAALRHLTVLSLSGCKVSRLPPEICLLDQLETLLMHKNKLTSLPELFWKLKESLRTLDISMNEFSEFPLVICRLSFLVNLNISYNSITSIPDDFKNLRSLTFLHALGVRITPPAEMHSEAARERYIPRVIERMTSLFCIGFTVERHVSKPISSKSNTGITTKSKPKKNVSPVIASPPIVAMSAEDEMGILEFIKHRAAASKQRRLAAASTGSSTVNAKKAQLRS